MRFPFENAVSSIKNHNSNLLYYTTDNSRKPASEAISYYLRKETPRGAFLMLHKVRSVQRNADQAYLQ